MRPRVFISSTYYDLKYIRNNIERFIEQYGFEPVLFESGRVTFEYNKQLDESCFNEVKLCHMMILIIGGRYGSPASEQKQQELIQNYEKGYMSITRGEFNTALESKIPVFIFIDKNVYAEYHTFSENADLLKQSIKNDRNEEVKFKFAHVDSINVFNFIDDVKINPIHTFEKFDDIDSYLRSQWAGMFFLYLNELQNKPKTKEINDSMSELKNITDRMNQMLTEVGKKVLGDNGEYEKVIEAQNKKLLKFLAQQISTNIAFKEYGSTVGLAREFVDLFATNILENDIFKNVVDRNANFFKNNARKLIDQFNLKLLSLNEKLIVKQLNLSEIIKIYYEEVKPLIEHDQELREIFLSESTNFIDDILDGLPF
ncbi:DUF4062 domain-containing protein [Paenibacillus sp. FSL H8-0034]|uniref:DUF4062 domain-containing protein n=1 Tax=Paenibacillus sp. FSL H8-0034 TaxID=2954671 RepID=UPI0030FAF81B